MKKCSCCQTIFTTEQWLALRYVGVGFDGEETTEYRNCPCNNTLVVSLHFYVQKFICHSYIERRTGRTRRVLEMVYGPIKDRKWAEELAKDLSEEFPESHIVLDIKYIGE